MTPLCPLGQNGDGDKTVCLTVIDEHTGGIILTCTIQDDNKFIHRRVPRQNIGVRIPGHNVTEDMKACAIRNIKAQAITQLLLQALESPNNCIDPHPGGKTFATSHSNTGQEAQQVRQILKDSGTYAENFKETTTKANVTHMPLFAEGEMASCFCVIFFAF